MTKLRGFHRRIDWSHLMVRILGGYVTLPTSTTLRSVDRSGERLVAATEVLKAVHELEKIYRGVIEDAAVEMIEEGFTWTEAAARSEFVVPHELGRRVGGEKRKEYRRGWYKNVA